MEHTEWYAKRPPRRQAGARYSIECYRLSVCKNLCFSLALFFCVPASACPEVVVPMDGRDPAFSSVAWKRALKAYEKRQHARAFKALSKTEAKLRGEIQSYFQPETEEATVNNSVIQKWLKRHVYHKNPGVLILGERFTFPALVWWAFADTACREGQFADAYAAILRVREVRDGPNAQRHQAMIAYRLGQIDAADKLLKSASRDGFLTPYLEGLIQRHRGEPGWKEKLVLAKKYSDLGDQRRAVTKELALEEAP